ncbi:MAG: hypothetical protein CVV64_09500 [Candidatus Wallbacteria bacterium HGW-Wallbacteria-1]|jgi:glycosyltransferase involved in cell wall biosynthesis|uniref:Glycosyltransferase 2-like domain-containing protein n=1 Tax=Candidatus Wallbacteria bacterium HGW-Wallbacteria-1 TaxID=2013854 RepID=A0A2N1PQN3_9BACT|nr:MAG: hypothetical protein CVV64_09500 [Candidatus Wallbacteria bacterium HGW-Wallbacteria-1]
MIGKSSDDTVSNFNCECGVSVNPNISIIIPVYNEERCIHRCLECILSQTRRDFEIIVIDDGSTDRTRETVAEFKGVKLLSQNHKGPAAARNMAVEQARGSILVFNDADMFMDSRYLEKLVAPVEDGSAPGTFPKEEYVDNKGNFWADMWSIDSDLPIGRRVSPDHPETSGVYRAMRREDFLAIGGYDDIGVGEDFTISRKMNALAHNAPGAIIYHENPGTLGETIRDARWYGRGWYMKKGISGKLRGLLRHLPPFSLVFGMAKAIGTGCPLYFPYKIIHGLAVAAGIVENMFSGSYSK